MGYNPNTLSEIIIAKKRIAKTEKVNGFPEDFGHECAQTKNRLFAAEQKYAWRYQNNFGRSNHIINL